MLTRRAYLKNSALVAAASALPSGLLRAFESSELITRAIPGTGEKLPIVGLGSSATFRSLANNDELAPLTEVFQTLVDNGGTVFDTAPGYGSSEDVAGRIVKDLGIADQLFWATKLNVVRRGSGGGADMDAAKAQLEQSFDRIGKDPIDLIQVHNVADIDGQIPLLQEYKEEGRIRYIGATSTRPATYPVLERAMREFDIDFIGIDYAVDNRGAAEKMMPLAADLGIAVLGYVPFGRSRLFSRVGDRAVPEWAQEIGIDTWGKFFIKYAASHPAITCVTPATSKAHHMLDNIGAAYGELPDAAMRKKMEELIDSLPQAS
jgi:aryl-alcohol dehydrogenase-like predicted oxidoreductase